MKGSSTLNNTTSLENETNSLIQLYNQGSYYDVIENGKLALAEFKNSYALYNIIGSAYTKIKKFDQAINFHKKSINFNPNFSIGYANLGYSYWELGQLTLAEKHCLKAVKMNPNYAIAYNTLGNIYQEKSKNFKAIKNFEKAINIDKNYDKAKFNLSTLHLFLGNFKQAWLLFEDRFVANNVNHLVSELSGCRWHLNMSISVTIWPEQGIGDFILYSRFFRDLIKATDNITALIDKKLKPIYERTFPDINFVTQLNTDSIDYHAPIGDLAKFYVNSFQDVKARSDVYLSVDKLRSEQIKQSLPKGKKICGISWISKNDNIGKNKSMTLEDMKDLLLLPDTIFIDLQYTDTSEERADFKKKYGVDIIKLDEIDNFNDIDGLASLIDACDQVVSVSNTTAHIAGAIGKETYLMLPKGKGKLWYWSKEKQQSIWYKSIQIIEQNEIGSWENVVQKIKDELKGVI